MCKIRLYTLNHAISTGIVEQEKSNMSQYIYIYKGTRLKSANICENGRIYGICEFIEAMTNNNCKK